MSEAVFYQRARGVAAHYEYAPFGEVIVQTRGNAWGSLDLLILNPWRFSSECADEASATICYNYRHYTPNGGVWIMRDPVSPLSGVNLYSFSRAAINRIDILGLYGSSVYGIVEDNIFTDDVLTAIAYLESKASSGINAYGSDSFNHQCDKPRIETETGYDKGCSSPCNFYIVSGTMTCRNVSKSGPIVMVKWTHGENVSEDAVLLYKAVYKLILEHEKEHRKIKESFTARLNRTYASQRSGCMQDPKSLKQEVALDLQDKADEFLLTLTRDWHDDNNKFDLDPKRRQSVDRLKREFVGRGR